MLPALRQMFGILWGVAARPRATFEALAAETSIRPAVLVLFLGVLLGWLNMLIFRLAGDDWLGTRAQLSDPTWVGLFGQVSVGKDHWVPIFAAITPLMAVGALAFMPGMTHAVSRLWRGQATFEQMVNGITFAVSVPALLIRSFSELLFGVPANLISGHPYWWTAAMGGEMGPVAAAIWNFFVIGIYAIGHDVWVIVLGTMAIRRFERIPVWAAALVMIFSYALWMYGIVATFTR